MTFRYFLRLKKIKKFPLLPQLGTPEGDAANDYFDICWHLHDRSLARGARRWLQ